MKAYKKRSRRTSADRSKRYDAMTDRISGRGTNADRLSTLRPQPMSSHAADSRGWYRSNGFIQNIVDAPAEDATREWISIRTNRDLDNPETGTSGLGINRLIENRMAELDVQSKLADLVRFSRMYAYGGFMFIGVNAEVPQETHLLKDSIPDDFKIEFLNVCGPERVSVYQSHASPLSRKFHKLTYAIDGFTINEERIIHLVNSWLPEEQSGISVIDTIMDAVRAQDTALWSVSSIIYNLAVWIFKSDAVSAMTPGKIAEFVSTVKSVLTTQSALALTDKESFERVGGSQAFTGVKELFDYIFENLAGLARMPKSRLMGQSQGVITAGQYDLLSYYDSIAKLQEIKLRPIIEYLISLIVKEKEGDIFNMLGGSIESLDWEFDFNPLWKLGPVEQADIELKQAQRDQAHIAVGVVSPSEIKNIRYAELESYPAWESTPVDFTDPKIESQEKTENRETQKKGLLGGLMSGSGK